MKQQDLEKELEALRQENNDMFNFMISSTKKEILNYAKSLKKTDSQHVSGTKSLNLTKTHSPDDLSHYTISQTQEFILSIMQSKK